MLEETNITSKEEIEKRIADIRMRSENLRNERTIHSEEEKRIINVLHNAETILNELDDTFEKRTSLSKTDISFLWVATALQLLRIYLLPKFQEKFEDENRLDHNNKEKKTRLKRNKMNISHIMERMARNNGKVKRVRKDIVLGKKLHLLRKFHMTHKIRKTMRSICMVENIV